jgi:hypothetical protein
VLTAFWHALGLVGNGFDVALELVFFVVLVVLAVWGVRDEEDIELMGGRPFSDSRNWLSTRDANSTSR